jgi:hypothetical protein
MSGYGAGSYREIRGVLSAEYRDLPDESVEAVVQASLGEVAPEDLEGFLSSLKDFGQAIAKAAPSVLPIVGTVAGTVLGGPVGAKLGGSLGQMAGGAIHGAASGQSASTIFQRAGGSLASQAASLIPGLGAAGGGSPAAAQLLAILNRPEIIQSLMSMALGSAGRSHIHVGGSPAAPRSPVAPGSPVSAPVPVPVGAFANLIGMLAHQASAEYNASVAHEGESVPSYLLDEGGEFRVDPAVPEHRAQLLLEMLNGSPPDEAEDDWSEVFSEYDQEDQEFDEDELYDMLELSELYAEDEY